jgi:aryl-alcohol dehydrogenase-like predicted oxidoreductase
MRTRTLGRSGISVGEIGLGTWQLSGEGYGPIERDTARRTIEAALDAESTFIDTAACYGPKGAVESLIGEVLAARGRDKAFIATRIGIDRDTNPKGPVRRYDRAGLTALAEESLKRLRTDHVDAFLLHNPRESQVVSRPEMFATLLDLRNEGKARLVGVSAGSIGVARAAIKADVDLVSIPYNILFPKLLHSLAHEIATSRVGVIVHSPLAYGLLADTWAADRVFGEDDHRAHRWGKADIARRVRQREGVRTLVRGDVLTVREAAIRYVLANRIVSVCVVGARHPEMARLNAHAADVLPYLPEEDLAQIGARMRSHGVQT